MQMPSEFPIEDSAQRQSLFDLQSEVFPTGFTSVKIIIKKPLVSIFIFSGINPI